MSSTEPKSNQRSPAKLKNGLRRFIFIIGLLSLTIFGFWYICIRMPGESAKALEDNSDRSTATELSSAIDLENQLKNYVKHLSLQIGERNLQNYPALCLAADYIEGEFKKFGYSAHRHTFQVNNLDCHNIVTEVRGNVRPAEIVIVGAHYDTAPGTPGANDNGSGVASMLCLANMLQDFAPDKTLRFVGFANEEPPYFQNRGQMGSWVYAESCRKSGDKIVAVLSLETMGYFTNEKDSQHYPAPLNMFYPSTGNFIGFVANLESSQLQRRAIKVFRENTSVPSEGAALPELITGIGWSDHWSFWQEGYPGIMVTDTAPFRYPHYHQPTDTIDKLDYAILAKVTSSLKFVVRDLCSTKN